MASVLERLSLFLDRSTTVTNAKYSDMLRNEQRIGIQSHRTNGEVIPFLMADHLINN